MRAHRLRKVGAGPFMLAGLALFAGAIAWPSWAQGTLQSRFAVGLFAVWCVAVAILLHPELSAGVAQGIREFRKTARDLRDEIGRLF